MQRLLHAGRSQRDRAGGPDDNVTVFVARHPELRGEITKERSPKSAEIPLRGCSRAGAIYRPSPRNATPPVHHRSIDGRDGFAQTPLELLVILAAIADERIPLQTIAHQVHRAFQQGASTTWATSRSLKKSSAMT